MSCAPDDRLPKTFDVAIIGTGLTESIISAAASRNGRTVLHLDPRGFYAATWATLNFDNWTSSEFAVTPPAVVASEFCSNDKLVWTNTCRSVQEVWYDEAVQEEFQNNKRRFNIDVYPQVVLAREELIELLINSNVSRYLEFLRIGKLFTSLPSPMDNVIESIPLSRADIFTSKSVSLAEKRSLVKFIEAILKPTEVESASVDSNEVEGGDHIPIPSEQDEITFKTFEEMVGENKLSLKVRHMIKSAVESLEDGFCSEDQSTFNQMFIPRCKRYLQSIGRFGNQTPYLWTLYGISEICQAFCRLSAVYGGIFILKRFITSIEVVQDGVKITSEGDEFLVKRLVLGPELQFVKGPSQETVRHGSKTVGRGVIVTRGGNLKLEDTKSGAKGDGICFYKINRLQVIELNHLSQAVPKDFKLLQISYAMNASDQETEVKTTIECILKPFVDFDPVPLNMDDENAATPSENSKPRALYGSYFLIDFFEGEDVNDEIYSCAVGDTDIASHIEKAREIFGRMFPSEEFLPKAPDMEPADDTEEAEEAEEDQQISTDPPARVEPTDNNETDIGAEATGT